MAARRSLLPVFCVGFLIFALLFVVVKNEQHANSRHIEAPLIREHYRNETCEATEMWYSIKRGTILILCGLPNSKLWGGLIFRVTENNGQRWLGDNCYEATAFTAKRSYWRRVIKRDKYAPIMNFPNIKRMFREWYQ